MEREVLAVETRMFGAEDPETLLTCRKARCDSALEARVS